jgi:hypothetical protein
MICLTWQDMESGRLERASTVAYVLSPFVGFAGLLAAGAIGYGIHRDEPAPITHVEISAPANSQQLGCIGRHTLRIINPEGRHELFHVANCIESKNTNTP